ncbi:MAG: hypothetical protein COA42_01610 [Alteromonadaceae bacterium]|nr:MAG: hypothetical protein COA42_01610 [Alteromonadaceae bacterium]
MLLVLLSLLALLTGSVFMYWLASNNTAADGGYILFQYGSFSFETTIVVGVLSLAFIFILAVPLIWTIKKIVNLLWASFRWPGRRKAQKLSLLANEGFVAFWEGSWSEALKKLLLAADKHSEPLMHYLAAAQSAHRLGQTEQAYQLLLEAEKNGEQPAVVVVVNRARMLLEDGKVDESVEVLNALLGKGDRGSAVVRQLYEAYRAQQNGLAMAAILPDLKSRKLLSESALIETERNIYLAELSACSKLGDEKNPLALLWKKIPKSFQKDVVIIAAYAEALNGAGDTSQAKILLEKTLNKQWHPCLLQAYGNLNFEDLSAVLVMLKAWLEKRESDAALLLLAARLSVKNGGIDDGFSYYAQSLDSENSREVQNELADLAFAQGQFDMASQLYRQVLAS